MDLRSWRRIFALLPLVILLAAVGCAHKRMPPPPPPVHEEPVVQTPPAVTPPDTTAKTIEQPAPMALQDVFFDFDKYNLRQEDQENLNSDGKSLTGNTDAKVLLEGHCDERGTVEYNLALGQRRADAVKDYLVKYGVDASRLSTISYGEERPFAQGHDEAAWAQNRRVHFQNQ